MTESSPSRTAYLSQRIDEPRKLLFGMMRDNKENMAHKSIPKGQNSAVEILAK